MRKITLFVTVVMLMAVVTMGQETEEPKQITLTSEEQELVRQNNNFAFDLFLKANTGDDLILSPLSITYALGMLNNGAAGQTQQEITQVLGGDSEASPLNDKGEMINVAWTPSTSFAANCSMRQLRSTTRPVCR